MENNQQEHKSLPTVCSTCGLELPLKQPRRPDRTRVFFCAGCGTSHMGVFDVAASMELWENVRYSLDHKGSDAD